MAETETEDRTQAPSNRRRQEARERGQAAYSSELSGAAGLLAASIVLAIRGESLAASLLSIVRAPLTGAIPVSADAAAIVAHLRSVAVGLAWPLGVVLVPFALASFAAHQAQTRGLWAPVLLAPDPSRLWAVGQGGGFGTRAARGLWSLAKAVIVVSVAAWVVRADWLALHRLGGLETPDLARAAGQSLSRLLLILSAATVALGLVDFAIQHRRFEAMLSLTPDEQREDLRSTEGDPSLRSRRRRLAQFWRGDPAELLTGSTLLLTGPTGLTIVLSGGPPPRPISVKSVVNGPSGDRLRRAAGPAGVSVVSAPGLALVLSRRRPLSPGQVAELAAVWAARS